MALSIRHPKDFWTGILFLCFGLGAVYLAQDHPMGTAGRMGPAYFPSVVGGLLALIGLAAVARSFLRDGEAIGTAHVRGLVLVLAPVLLFGVVVRGAGLVPAVLLLVLASACASPATRLRGALLLAAGLAAFAALLFVGLLDLPMPVIGPWLGSW